MNRVSIAVVVVFALIVALFFIAPLAILAPIGVALNAFFPNGFGPVAHGKDGKPIYTVTVKNGLQKPIEVLDHIGACEDMPRHELLSAGSSLVIHCRSLAMTYEPVDPVVGRSYCEFRFSSDAMGSSSPSNSVTCSANSPSKWQIATSVSPSTTP